MTIKQLVVSGAIALSTLAIGAGALAQNNASPMNLAINGGGQVALSGTVSAVSANTISVNSWLGTWTVNATTTGIAVGDSVKVAGTLGTGMTVNTAVVKNASVAKKALTGTISNLNATAGTFTLATEHSGNVTVQTNTNTQISVNGAASTFANLTAGSKATVSGSFNATTNVVTADSIKVPSVELNGEHKGWFKTHIDWSKFLKSFWKK